MKSNHNRIITLTPNNQILSIVLSFRILDSGAKIFNVSEYGLYEILP